MFAGGRLRSCRRTTVYGVTGGDAKRTLCVVVRWSVARPYCAGGAAANAANVAKRRVDALRSATHHPPLGTHPRDTSAPGSMGFLGRHARVRRAFAIWQISDDGGRSVRNVRILSWQPLDGVMPAVANSCAATIF
ncbi:hypothetical protein ACI65C_002613 [Semiaphis heraclei]